MKRPFVFLSTSLVLGILTGYYFELDLSLILVTLALFTILYLLLDRDIFKNTFYILVLVFYLGLFLMYIENIEGIETYVGQDLEMTGEVMKIDKLDKDYGKYLIRLDSLRKDGSQVEEKSKFMLTTDRIDLNIGDRLEITSKIKQADENTNPLLFNYRRYLRSRGVRVIGYSSGEDIHIVSAGNKPLIRLKKTIYEKIDHSFRNLRARNRGFLKSLTLGQDRFMDPEDIDDFRDLGLAHILAVSGLHLGIIVGFLILVLNLLTIDRRLINIIALVFIFIYTYVVDFSPSILRAGIMIAISLLAINLRRYSDSVNNLFLVSFLLAVFNPYIIFNVGFQLSFLATLSLLVIPRRLEAIFTSRESAIYQSLLAIIGVQIGILPLVIYYFNYINLLGILANLIIVPIISLILPLGFILFTLPGRLDIINYFISLALNELIDLVFIIKSYLSSLDIFSFQIGSPSFIAIILYYLIICLLLKIIRIDRFPRELNKLIISSLIVIFSLNLISFCSDNQLSIEFIDVDQGDSSLIRHRGKNYLVDTGGNVFKNFDIARNIVIPYLEKQGVRRLDGVFISHFDGDHCKSLVDIMDEIDIDSIYVGYKREDNSYYREIVSKANDKGIPVYLLTRGDKLPISKDASINILYPSGNIDSSLSDNDLSLVMELDYQGIKTLFTGDIEEVGEGELVASGLARVDFLKVPHHGSKTSSSEEFLDRINPRSAFIQVGRDNSFSHPNQEILDRYEARDIEVYRTDDLGRISLVMEENNYRISGFIREKYSIINVIVYSRYIITKNIIFIWMLLYLVRLYKVSKELDSFEF